MVENLPLLFDWRQTPGFLPGFLPCPFLILQPQGARLPDEPKVHLGKTLQKKSQKKPLRKVHPLNLKMAPLGTICSNTSPDVTSSPSLIDRPLMTIMRFFGVSE